MAIAKVIKNTKLDELEEQISILFICPICKCEKKLLISKEIVNHAKQLTTISIPKGKICLHHFQAFLDKNFKVRGYQKVDFAFELDEIVEKKFPVYSFKVNDEDLINNIKLSSNHIEYHPKLPIQEKKKNNQTKKSHKKENEKISKGNNVKIEKKEMTIQEIYEQFWEFIDDDNHEFKELILKDSRRKRK